MDSDWGLNAGLGLFPLQRLARCFRDLRLRVIGQSSQDCVAGLPGSTQIVDQSQALGGREAVERQIAELRIRPRRSIVAGSSSVQIDPSRTGPAFLEGDRLVLGIDHSASFA